MASKKGSGAAIRTGVFVILGFALFVGALFVLGARKQLFEDVYEIYSTYEDVGGLQEGAFVRIAGINVGTVKKIALPELSQNRVVVTFSIRGDARRLIRRDSKAIIDTEGLLGARIVIIVPGSPDEPEVPEGGTIQGQSPIQLHRFSANIDRALEHLDAVVINSADLLAAGSSILQKVDAGQGTLGELVNNPALYDTVISSLAQFRRVAATADGTLRNVQGLAGEIAGSVDRTLTHYSVAADTLRDAGSEFRRTAKATNTILRDLQEGRGTLGKLMTDDSAYVALNNTIASSKQMLDRGTEAIAEITRAANSIARSAEQTRATIDLVSRNVMQGQGTVGRLLTDDSVYTRLDRVLANLDISSQKLAVNMEALRTNWLFRGYFEDAGYWENTKRTMELVEQRNIRLNEWERRLQRIQADLEARERRLEAQSRQAAPARRDTSQESR
ncbi:MAG TPA: MlaD family protein [Candidatus Latescibacteria bacterium]|nr:MlaD family protein [Candidatus Latescibacterota bacterium]HQE61406.1 MlaD family protein [Candidatus Latescibacterota bacterium]HQK21637.1 MlaD family protein [Candidatus Latescibacterota bacterium]